MSWQQKLRDAIRERYAIDYEIGRGGMAAVFKARDLRHNRDVAVKVILPEVASELAADRFVREIEIAAKLSHPHILPLLESGQVGEFLYYVMPLVEGESLRDRLARERCIPLPDALKIVQEVTTALAFAHSRGVVHRDIKPENIMLSGGVAVVTDFGIARAISDHRPRISLTQEGFAVGTPAYMSPEQASGNTVDARSDIYSFACLLYEMLGGEVPFDGLTPQAIYVKQLESPPPSIVTRGSGLPPQFDAVLRKALSPEPAERYRSVEDFQTAVERCVTSKDLTTRETVPIAGQSGPPGSPARRAAWGPTVGVGIAVGLAAIFGNWLVNREPAIIATTDVALFPFRTSGDAAAGMGEGIADLAAAAIDGTVGVSVADPAALWADLRSDGRLAVPDIAQAMALSRKAGARYFVLGSITTLGQGVELTARVYTDAGDVAHTARVSLPFDSLASAVDRMAIEIVGAIWKGVDNPVVPSTEALATGSIEALQAYLEARGHAARGNYDQALASIERSTTADTAFALAYLEHFNIQSMLLYQNGQPFSGLTPLIDRAMQYRERLPPRERYRIEGHKALDQTNGAGAATAFERILAIDPTDWEARRSLAFTYLLYGWQIDKGLNEIEVAVGELLAIDSLSVPDRTTAARLAALSGDADQLNEHLRVLSAFPDNALAAASATAFAVVASTPANEEARFAAALGEAIPTVTTVIRELRMARPDLALRFMEALTRDSMPVRHQQTGSGALAQMRMGVGQITRADSTIRAGDYDRIRATLNRFFVTASMAEVGDSGAAARAVRELETFAPADSLSAYLSTKPGVWATGWAVGAYEATFGDTSAARVWQESVANLPVEDTLWDWRGSLSDDIEGRLAIRRNDLVAAERFARRAYERWAIHSSNVLESEPEPAIRFHLATILLIRGQTDEARRLLHSFMPPHNWAAFYTARAAFELGGIAAEAEEWSTATLRYGQAVALWRLGGAEVADWRQRAEAGLNAAVEAGR